MRNAIILAILISGCASRPPLSGRYAVVLEPSVGAYGSSLQRAFIDHIPTVQFIQRLYTSVRYDALVVIRGLGCLNRFDSAGCGAVTPSSFGYEIYRGGRLVDQGRANAAVGYESRASSVANALASDIARALAH